MNAMSGIEPLDEPRLQRLFTGDDEIPGALPQALNERRRWRQAHSGVASETVAAVYDRRSWIFRRSYSAATELQKIISLFFADRFF
jgi:hypothetical protein